MGIHIGNLRIGHRVGGLLRQCPGHRPQRRQTNPGRAPVARRRVGVGAGHRHQRPAHTTTVARRLNCHHRSHGFPVRVARDSQRHVVAVAFPGWWARLAMGALGTLPPALSATLAARVPSSPWETTTARHQPVTGRTVTLPRRRLGSATLTARTPLSSPLSGNASGIAARGGSAAHPPVKPCCSGCVRPGVAGFVSLGDDGHTPELGLYAHD